MAAPQLIERSVAASALGLGRGGKLTPTVAQGARAPFKCMQTTTDPEDREQVASLQ